MNLIFLNDFLLGFALKKGSQLPYQPFLEAEQTYVIPLSFSCHKVSGVTSALMYHGSKASKAPYFSSFFCEHDIPSETDGFS
jgi:hypothetical protein